MNLLILLALLIGLGLWVSHLDRRAHAKAKADALAGVTQTGHTPSGPGEWLSIVIMAPLTLIAWLAGIAFLVAITWIAIKAFLVALAWAF